MTLALGFDLGTGAIRACVHDVASGAMLGSAEEPYETAYPRPGWAEQQPEEWWSGLLRAGRRAVEAAGRRDIVGVAVATTASNGSCLPRRRHAGPPGDPVDGLPSGARGPRDEARATPPHGLQWRRGRRGMARTQSHVAAASRAGGLRTGGCHLRGHRFPQLPPGRRMGRLAHERVLQMELRFRRRGLRSGRLRGARHSRTWRQAPPARRAGRRCDHPSSRRCGRGAGPFHAPAAGAGRHRRPYRHARCRHDRPRQHAV